MINEAGSYSYVLFGGRIDTNDRQRHAVRQRKSFLRELAHAVRPPCGGEPVAREKAASIRAYE